MSLIISIDPFKLNDSTIQKIEEKNEILQFMPSQLEELSKVKTINYNGVVLKTSYIIDIIHNLIFKYYFKENNTFNLYSKLLKKKYGKYYNTYIDYMVKHNHIGLIKDYSKGKSSREYSLNVQYLHQKIKRYSNTDKVLLKKYKEKVLDNSIVENNIIHPDIKSKLINDLFSVNIEMDKVIFFLDNLNLNDTNIYNKNRYSSESIGNGDIFHHFDRYGRMHTNFTTLKSFIRKNCLLIDGDELCEFDIKNSQPLFLTKIIIDSCSKWVNKDELSFFRDLTVNGGLYKFMMNRFGIKTKKEIKTMIYKVLFGMNNLRNKENKIFHDCFPTIYNFIKLYKKEHNNDYKILSHHLQKQESNFIFNKLVKTIMIQHPEVKIITVHDSIVVQSKYKDIIKPIFEQKLKEEFNF